MPTFHIPLTDLHAEPFTPGYLEVHYTASGITRVCYKTGQLVCADLPVSMLQTTLFTTVMEQVQAAVANNAEPDESHFIQLIPNALN